MINVEYPCKEKVEKLINSDQTNKLCSINAPLYIIDGILYNEYELRTILVMVAKGEISSPVKVYDLDGNMSIIREDGSLTNDLEGLDISDELAIMLLRLQK